MKYFICHFTGLFSWLVIDIFDSIKSDVSENQFLILRLILVGLTCYLIYMIVPTRLQFVISPRSNNSKVSCRMLLLR